MVKNLAEIKNHLKKLESVVMHERLPLQERPPVQEQNFENDVLETEDFPLNTVAIVKHYEERLKKENNFKEALVCFKFFLFCLTFKF